MTIERACPTCGAIRCTEHKRGPWANSNRRERTTSGWEQQRRAKRVLYMHDTICHVCQRPLADQVDHVIPLSAGGTDTLDNLRPIHATPCHAAKSAKEATRARGL